MLLVHGLNSLFECYFFQIEGTNYNVGGKDEKWNFGKTLFFYPNLSCYAMIWSKKRAKNGADFYDSRQIESKMALRH